MRFINHNTSIAPFHPLSRNLQELCDLYRLCSLFVSESFRRVFQFGLKLTFSDLELNHSDNI